jgi:inner membrane protein
MSPITHGLMSWLVAEAVAPTAEPAHRRARIAITAAGLIPDLDGLGAPFEVLSGGKLAWFSDWHHVLCHNLIAALVVGIAAWAWCRRSWQVGLAALAAFHLHLLGDLIGARGPDGYAWPVPYLLPFSPWEASVSWSWRLDAWPNQVITGILLLATILLAVRRQRSPVDLFSTRADAQVVACLRRWTGR